MKAWTLDSTSVGLRLEEVPDPVLQDGAAVLRMHAVQVPAYTRVLTTGGRGGIATPTVLGISGIGRVEVVAEDVHTARPGEIALCTGLLNTGRIAEPEEVLLGWTGIGGRGASTAATDAMRRVWRTGTFAERALMPASTLVALPCAERYPDLARLAFLPWLAVAGGAVERSAMVPGDRVVVIGASDQLGGATVLLALARGAGAVAAIGRNADSLDRLAALDSRVRTVRSVGDRKDRRSRNPQRTRGRGRQGDRCSRSGADCRPHGGRLSRASTRRQNGAPRRCPRDASHPVRRPHAAPHHLAWLVDGLERLCLLGLAADRRRRSRPRRTRGDQRWTRRSGGGPGPCRGDDRPELRRAPSLTRRPSTRKECHDNTSPGRAPHQDDAAPLPPYLRPSSGRVEPAGPHDGAGLHRRAERPRRKRSRRRHRIRFLGRPAAIAVEKGREKITCCWLAGWRPTKGSAPSTHRRGSSSTARHCTLSRPPEGTVSPRPLPLSHHLQRQASLAERDAAPVRRARVSRSTLVRPTSDHARNAPPEPEGPS